MDPPTEQAYYLQLHPSLCWPFPHSKSLSTTQPALLHLTQFPDLDPLNHPETIPLQSQATAPNPPK